MDLLARPRLPEWSAVPAWGTCWIPAMGVPGAGTAFLSGAVLGLPTDSRERSQPRPMGLSGRVRPAALPSPDLLQTVSESDLLRRRVTASLAWHAGRDVEQWAAHADAHRVCRALMHIPGRRARGVLISPIMYQSRFRDKG
jgi:hypothetical protein